MKRKQHTVARHTRFIAAALAVLMLPFTGQSLVLCIGEDCHVGVSVETASEACCNASPRVEAGITSGESDDCGACFDIQLSARASADNNKRTVAAPAPILNVSAYVCAVPAATTPTSALVAPMDTTPPPSSVLRC